jgi:thioredoxin 1
MFVLCGGENMSQNGNGKAKLIKFSAPWCAPCKTMNPIVEMATNEVDIELVDINVDEDADSAREYKVRSIPTLILVKGEEVVDKLIGRASLDQVRAFLSQA